MVAPGVKAEQGNVCHVGDDGQRIEKHILPPGRTKGPGQTVCCQAGLHMDVGDDQVGVVKSDKGKGKGLNIDGTCSQRKKGGNDNSGFYKTGMGEQGHLDSGSYLMLFQLLGVVS